MYYYYQVEGGTFVRGAHVSGQWRTLESHSLLALSCKFLVWNPGHQAHKAVFLPLNHLTGPIWYFKIESQVTLEPNYFIAKIKHSCLCLL